MQGASVYIYTHLHLALKKNMMKFAISNIVRIFANNIRDMEEKKDYTVTQEQLARFAKALGHPARIAIMHFFGKAENVLFWGYSRRTSHCQSNRITALERVERCRTYTRRG